MSVLNVTASSRIPRPVTSSLLLSLFDAVFDLCNLCVVLPQSFGRQLRMSKLSNTITAAGFIRQKSTHTA
jgi:hypothetical protein